jgi:hypothetical protein
MLPSDRGGTIGLMEIRIILDRVEPPVGRLWVVAVPGRGRGCRQDGEIGFTGWLGLLRALYQVTGEPGPGSLRGP